MLHHRRCFLSPLLPRLALSLPNRFMSSQIQSFQDLKLEPELIENLNKMGITAPSEIQAKTLPLLLDSKSVVFYAETGSGKTLCYLLPIINRLLQSKKLNKPKLELSERNLGLKGLVLEPSVELTYQVGSILKKLVEGTDLKVALISSGMDGYLKRETDVLVSTPASLRHFGPEKVFSNLEVLALDEVDALITGGTKRTVFDMLRVINTIQIEKRSQLEEEEEKEIEEEKEKEIQQVQYIFSAATLPQNSLKNPLSFIEKHYPGIIKVKSNSVHKTVSTVEEEFIRLSPKEKLPLLLKHLQETPAVKTLIFVRTLEQAETLTDFLASNLITSEMIVQRKESSERVDVMKKLIEGDFQNLISTDLGSRGLDLPGIQRVIQFDFALNAVDYLHRAGRTGRMKKSGKVISYICKEDEDLAKAIQSTQLREDLSQVFSRNRGFRRRLKKNAILGSPEERNL